MILSKSSYLQEVKIEPAVDEWQTGAVALDLRIGTTLYRPETKCEEEIPEHGVIIHYKEHFLIKTLERVTLPNGIVGVVYPRSGTNRRGITVDMTGIVDPLYSGHLMIPVTNMTRTPVQFHRGERIAQIVFERCEAVPDIKQSKYHEGGIAAKPDKEEELKMLIDGTLFAVKTEMLNRS